MFLIKFLIFYVLFGPRVSYKRIDYNRNAANARAIPLMSFVDGANTFNAPAKLFLFLMQ